MSAVRASRASRIVGRTLLLALAGVGTLVFFGRRASRAQAAEAAPGVPDPVAPRAAFAELEADAFDRLCTAYYEARGFRVKPVRWRNGDRDAELYFGTLAHPVALLRCLAPRAGPADVDAIIDLPGMASARGIGRAFVHATGAYTGAASSFARDHRTRLISGADFARSIAGMPHDDRLPGAAAIEHARPTATA